MNRMDETRLDLTYLDLISDSKNLRTRACVREIFACVRVRGGFFFSRARACACEVEIFFRVRVHARARTHARTRTRAKFARAIYNLGETILS